MNKSCCFAGHRDVYGDGGLAERVYCTLRTMIQTGGVTTFLTGGMGGFDSLCETKVRLLKREFPQVRLEWILPYETNDFRQNESYFRRMYDDIILPLPGVHFKAAVPGRNRWMVEQSSVVLAYLCRPQSGAYQTARYALRRGVSVINLGTEKGFGK